MHRLNRSVRLAVALGLVASFVAACGNSPSSSENARPSVVAAFYPVYEAATRITDDKASVTNLTTAGVEPHDVELTTKQVDAIIDADVVLYLGQGFQPAVEETVKRATGTKVDLLSGIELRETAEDEHASDPHVWLDPQLWSRVVGRIARAIEQADPEHAADDRTRAQAYQRSVETLHDAYRSGLASCRRHTIVTSHAAFGYLAARYGLEQVPISGVSPDAEPSPKRIAEIADLVEREKISTIFTESLVSPRVAATLAREAGVRTAVFDPVEGLTPEQVSNGLTYVKVMQKNLSVLREALDCR